jgi:hypothetical protein
MNLARALAVCALVGGLTACDHSSRHDAGPRPYTPGQVREAFAAVGINLSPLDSGLVGITPGLRARFTAYEDDIGVGVYKIKTPSTVVTLAVAGEEPPELKTARNVLVTYPKHSRLRPKIRRALLLLSGRAKAGPGAA